ncbi:aldehyde dehydrogenase family protein [Sphingobium sufflavum]|nr:aldehyde dehydrogenase family protein [Sphingobium sufflavum]MCE7795562.1 aldehyde dehydrogenase family protein [Sphingobium sufflavum]
MGLYESAKKDGARLVAGGERAGDEALAGDFFIQPTIFADVHNDMRLAHEEIFGPVLGIIPFDTEDEAIRIGNDTPYGLACGIWTRDIDRAMRMTHAMRACVVWVNTYRTLAAQGPFDGMKDSGFGRERGAQGLLEFTTTKNVMIDYSGDVHDAFAMKL